MHSLCRGAHPGSPAATPTQFVWCKMLQKPPLFMSTCRASMPPSAPRPAPEEPPVPAGEWFHGQAALSHLLPLMSGSMERQLRAFSCSPRALGTAHYGILGCAASREAQQSLSALRIHASFLCLREPRLRQEEGPVDVYYWKLCWLLSVAQKPLGSVLPPALFLLQAVLGGKESLGCVHAEKSPWLCAS